MKLIPGAARAPSCVPFSTPSNFATAGTGTSAWGPAAPRAANTATAWTRSNNHRSPTAMAMSQGTQGNRWPWWNGRSYWKCHARSESSPQLTLTVSEVACSTEVAVALFLTGGWRERPTIDAARALPLSECTGGSSSEGSSPLM